MTTSEVRTFPPFVVFEGVDGSGKTTFATGLRHYYQQAFSDSPLYSGSFPGTEPGTLGEWVYRLHHDTAANAPDPRSIAPAALQLLHVAAHVDVFFQQIAPTFSTGGKVILDRYWWSAYAYARMHLSSDQAWALVNAERIFWNQVPQPVIIYLTRQVSLKTTELSVQTHALLNGYYHEVVTTEQRQAVQVHTVSNDGAIEDTWQMILTKLALPLQPLVLE